MSYPPQHPPAPQQQPPYQQPAGWPPVPPQPAPKKTNAGQVAAVVFAVVALLCLCGVLVGALDDDTDTTAGDTADATTAGTEATTTAPTSAAPEKPKKWTKVITLSGNANKRSAPFELAGGRTRLTYDVKGADPLAVVIYVMEKDTSLEKDGGFAEVSPDTAGKDSTELSKDAGTYYLEVKSANAKWTVTIEELR